MPEPAALVSAEENGLRRLSPRRNRWPELAALDAAAFELEARKGASIARAQALRDALNRAPQTDAEAFAAWELNGRQGPRPESAIEGLEREVRQVDAEIAGLDIAFSQALAQKVAFVEKHRRRLVADAEKEAAAAHARLVGLVDEIEQAREELAELRATSVWASLYPHEQAGREPRMTMVGGGLTAAFPKEFGIGHQVEYRRLLETVRKDADWLLDAAATNEQRALLENRDPRQRPGVVWEQSPEAQQERRAEVDEIVRAFVAEWGREPTESEFHAFVNSRRNGIPGLTERETGPCPS
jgi:hypothetical protein